MASRGPHQFRTRINLIEAQRMRTESNKSTVKSTKLIAILSLITVWLQVRVLPGPPRKSAGSPAGALVVRIAPKATAGETLRLALERRGFVIEAGTVHECGRAVSARRRQMNPARKAA
jgi:hypothetical protein